MECGGMKSRIAGPELGLKDRRPPLVNTASLLSDLRSL